MEALNSTLTTISDNLLQTENLTWVERQWANIFQGRNEFISLTVFAFIYREIIYFGKYVPWWICGKIKAFDKYKLQPDKEISEEQHQKCLNAVLKHHFLIEAPLQFGFHPVATFFGMKISEVPLPSWTTMFFQTFLCLVFEDFFHYVFHRILHYGPLYKNIHKMHHEYSAPYGLAAEYAHPIEIIILGMGTLLGPILIATSGFDLHVFTVIFFITCRTFQAVDAHSGYDFPWSLHNWVPFWAGAEHHDYHHQAFIGCYSSSFRWWDTIFGTDDKYHAFRAQQKIKAEAKSAEAKSQ